MLSDNKEIMESKQSRKQRKRGGKEPTEVLFLQMELCSQKTLSTVLEEERIMGGGQRQNRLLHIREISSIFRQLLLSLDVLQQCGVVHRDIKPANVFFTE